jgi:phosphate:Na+ symporter
MQIKRNFLLLLLFMAAGLLLDNSAASGQDSIKLHLKKPVHSDAYNYSGDRQSGKVNSFLEKSIKVKVTGSKKADISDVAVEFRVITTPENAKGFKVKDSIVLTNQDGIATNRFKLGDKPGKYEIAAYINNSGKQNFLIYSFRAREEQWGFFLIIGLLGGLGLFLLGMIMLSEGMRNAAGDRMRSVLSSVTHNRFTSVGIGTLVTTVIQSSSATTVMLVSFVQSGLMKYRQTLGVILGAGIGTTITAQIIAFKLTDYALLLVALGFVLNYFFKKNQVKYLGRVILGFGVLFFGMHVMSESMAPLKDYAPFIKTMLELENPLLGILVGAVFTALIQSSSAFIGIMITLSIQGLLTLDASIPLILGANIGTSATALLATLKTGGEARKVAMSHAIFKVFGALLFVWWLPGLADLVRGFSPVSGIDNGMLVEEQTSARQIANIHMIFNVALTLILLPFLDLFAKLMYRLYPKSKSMEMPELKTYYLDKNVLKSSGSLALNLAKQEVLRVGEIVEDMLTHIIEPFLTKKRSNLQYIQNREREVNFLRDQIKDYLLKISRKDIDEPRLNEVFQLIYTIKELEQIADLISTNLSDKAEGWCRSNLEFSEEGKSELLDYYNRALKQLHRSREVLDAVNLEKAREMKKKYKKYRNMAIELEKNHFERLKEEVNKSVSSSKTHLELIGTLKIINERATNIARILLKWSE